MYRIIWSCTDLCLGSIGMVHMIISVHEVKDIIHTLIREEIALVIKDIKLEGLENAEYKLQQRLEEQESTGK